MNEIDKISKATDLLFYARASILDKDFIPLVRQAIDILEKSSQSSARKLVPILNGVIDLGSSDTEASIGAMQYCRGILSRTANCMRENGCQEGCGYSC
jgi:hypothetical protein